MTALGQTISDLKLIAQTDKRVWSAGAFLCVVFFVWSVTGAWREEEEPLPEKLVNLKVEQPKIKPMLKEFNAAMREGAEERQYLKDYAVRVAQELETTKQEIDWHVDVLVNKLNDMTEKVDNIANKVGASAVHKEEFNQKLKKHKAKERRKKAVDRSSL